jgi:hypothetical protein
VSTARHGSIPAAACLIALLAATGTAGDSLPAARLLAPPEPDPGALAIEFATSAVGGAICAAGLRYLFRPVADTSEPEWKTFGGTVISGSIGYPLFCGLGAWVGGRMCRKQGRLVPALVGAFATAPVAISAAWAGVLLENSPRVTIKSSIVYAAAALIPAIGAVWGYNWSIPKRPGGRAAVQLGPPAAELTTITGPNGQPESSVNVRLLSLKF